MADPAELTTVVSTKGQIVLPKSIRARRLWDAGTRLVIEDVGEGVLLRRAAPFAATEPAQVFAMLAVPGAAKTLEEMADGIRAEARRRHARG